MRKLSPSERTKYDCLTIDSKREAFKIVRNWSQTDSPDFKVHCKTLGERIGVTLQNAADIRRYFCLRRVGILQQTAEYVPHKLAAHYKWIADL